MSIKKIRIEIEKITKKEIEKTGKDKDYFLFGTPITEGHLGQVTEEERDVFRLIRIECMLASLSDRIK